MITYEIEVAKIDDVNLAKDGATASPGDDSEDTLENGVSFLINRCTFDDLRTIAVISFHG